MKRNYDMKQGIFVFLMAMGRSYWPPVRRIR